MLSRVVCHPVKVHAPQLLHIPVKCCAHSVVPRLGRVIPWFAAQRPATRPSPLFVRAMATEAGSKVEEAAAPARKPLSFGFATAGRIVFGRGKAADVPGIVEELGGTKVMVVTGRSQSRAAPLVEALEKAGKAVVVHSIAKEPTTHLIKEACEVGRSGECDIVVGFGGGSVLDSGKAIAALLANGGAPLDYLEVIGDGKKLKKRSLPYVAVPTTAGTGAEVTKNAVLMSPEHNVKVSLRSEFMLPTVAVVDPLLTVSTPASVTRSCGLDAFTQCLEPFVSHLATPVTDGFCREGMRRAARSLRKAIEDGSDVDAREDMCVTSLLGGLALANAKLGCVHGFAGPLGGMFPTAPHGAVCAATLPHVMRANIAALKERMPDSVYLARYTEIGQILTGRADATAEDGCTWVADLCKAVGVPGLAEYGVKEEHFEAIIAKSSKSSSMKGNPIKLSSEELAAVLKLSL